MPAAVRRSGRAEGGKCAGRGRELCAAGSAILCALTVAAVARTVEPAIWRWASLVTSGALPDLERQPDVGGRRGVAPDGGAALAGGAAAARATDADGALAESDEASWLALGRRSAVRRRSLPAGPLIVGYRPGCELNKTVAEVQQGVNVIIWFALGLQKNETTGQPMVVGGLNFKCIAEVAQALEAMQLQVSHLVCIGGWDAPHPDTSFTGEQWFATWDQWNKALPRPFDGFDWDLEGNDNLASRWNTMTPAVLNLVVDMSAAGKSAGYLVSMVPAQSYLDSTTGDFNLSLTNAYPDWHPEFHYRGMNCYAYLLAAAPPDTFDLVLVQLYETWSRAGQALYQQGESPVKYLQDLAVQYISGWEVDFGSFDGLRVTGKRFIQIPREKLSIGFSFGARDGRSVYFRPEDAGQAFVGASEPDRPSGYFFWEIDIDGMEANGTTEHVNFAHGLNEYLHVRPVTRTMPAPSASSSCGRWTTRMQDLCGGQVEELAVAA